MVLKESQSKQIIRKDKYLWAQRDNCVVEIGYVYLNVNTILDVEIK
jgi:hypothetical protein